MSGRWGERKPAIADFFWYRDGDWDERPLEVTLDADGRPWAHLPDRHRVPVSELPGQWSTAPIAKPEEPTDFELADDITPVEHRPAIRRGD